MYINREHVHVQIKQRPMRTCTTCIYREHVPSIYLPGTYWPGTYEATTYYTKVLSININREHVLLNKYKCRPSEIKREIAIFDLIYLQFRILEIMK